MDWLEIRRLNYETLAYYEARANAALAKGNIAAHVVWARKWHRLNRALQNV